MPDQKRRVPDNPVAEWIRENDGLPGERAALPPGSLEEHWALPQGDEHRHPVLPGGTHNTVTDSDDLQRSGAPLIDPSPKTPGRARMSGVTDKARDIFIVGLRNQHAVENQAIELLERQIGRLKNYPEMVGRMRQHVTESKEQARRIEDLLSELGTSHSSLKDTAMSFVANMMAMGHTVAPDEVLKNTLANFAFEQYEIASYVSLLTLAEAVGHNAAKAALNESLREEERMAQWISDHIGPTTLRYVERTEAGQTAGI